MGLIPQVVSQEATGRNVVRSGGGRIRRCSSSAGTQFECRQLFQCKNHVLNFTKSYHAYQWVEKYIFTSECEKYASENIIKSFYRKFIPFTVFFIFQIFE